MHDVVINELRRRFAVIIGIVKDLTEEILPCLPQRIAFQQHVKEVLDRSVVRSCHTIEDGSDRLAKLVEAFTLTREEQRGLVNVQILCHKRYAVENHRIRTCKIRSTLAHHHLGVRQSVPSAAICVVLFPSSAIMISKEQFFCRRIDSNVNPSSA